LPYEHKLSHLELWSLEERRNRSDLIEVFEVVKGLSANHWSLFFHRANDSKSQLETKEEEEFATAIRVSASSLNE